MTTHTHVSRSGLDTLRDLLSRLDALQDVNEEILDIAVQGLLTPGENSPLTSSGRRRHMGLMRATALSIAKTNRAIAKVESAISRGHS